MEPAVINRETPKEERVRKIDVLRPAAGDVILFQTSGGGGFGNPLLRDPDRVRSDVESGFVSRAAAERDYGVIFTEDGEVDLQRTAAVRQARQASCGAHDGSLGRYNFGKERNEFERVWTREARNALRRRTDLLPALIRSAVKNRVYEALNVRHRVEAITVDEISAMFAQVTSAMNLTDLYEAPAQEWDDVERPEELSVRT